MTNGNSSSATWDAEAYAGGLLVGVVFVVGVAVGATLSDFLRQLN